MTYITSTNEKLEKMKLSLFIISIGHSVKYICKFIIIPLKIKDILKLDFKVYCHLENIFWNFQLKKKIKTPKRSGKNRNYSKKATDTNVFNLTQKVKLELINK